MARKTKKFHRIKSKKLTSAIRARRKAAKEVAPQAPVDSRSLLATVDLG